MKLLLLRKSPCSYYIDLLIESRSPIINELLLLGYFGGPVTISGLRKFGGLWLILKGSKTLGSI